MIKTFIKFKLKTNNIEIGKKPEIIIEYEKTLFDIFDVSFPYPI